MPVCRILRNTAPLPSADRSFSSSLGLREAPFYALCKKLDGSHDWKHLVPGADQDLKLDIRVKPLSKSTSVRQCLCKPHFFAYGLCIIGSPEGTVHIEVYGARLLCTSVAKSAKLPFAFPPLGENQTLGDGGTRLVVIERSSPLY